MIMRDAWKLMVGRLPKSEIREDDSVTGIFGHVPLAFMNVAMLNRPMADTSDLRQALALAGKQASGCAHPSLTILVEDLVPTDWASVAAEAGLTPAMTLREMETDELLPPRRPAPEIELRQVTDEATARDLAMINADAYGMPRELFECICNMHLWHDDSYGFVGYVDGRPVTSAAALPLEDSVYVALVATAPDMHGRGYADTVMRHAVTVGQQAMGLKRTTLHATEMGEPVYRAMGYGTGSRLILLAPGGH